MGGRMAFKSTATAELRKLNLSPSAHEQATAVTSRLASHYKGQPFLWGVSEQEQYFFPLNVGLPPDWGGLHMKYVFLVRLGESGYAIEEIGRHEIMPLLREPPALSQDKMQLVADVTRILTMTCWGVIQDPPLIKNDPVYWINWINYFKTNNSVMEQFMSDALIKLQA